MNITVGKAMELSAMENATLVAGHKGIDRIISSVNIMEVPDIIRFVKKDELLLTTTYPIKDNPEALEQLIPTLVEKGVAALAIKPVFYDNKVPEIMIRQANEHDFPLIQLPRTASFNELINPILGEILNRQARILKRNDDAQKNFANIVLHGGSFEDIAKMLAVSQNTPVSIHSSSFHLLASASPNGDGLYSDVFPILDLLYKELASKFGDQTGRFTTQIQDTIVDVYVQPVIVAGEDYAHLVLWLDEHSSYETNVIEQASTVVALEIVKMRAVLETERRFRTQFIEELLQGRITQKADVLSRGAAYDWDLSVPYTPVILEITDLPDMQRVKQLWIAVLQAASNDEIITLNMGTRTLLLFKTDTRRDNQALLTKWLDTIEREVVSETNVLYAGIGRVLEDIMDLKKGVDQGVKALEIGRLIYPDKAVIHYDELGIYRVLSPLVGDEEADAFVQESLGALLNHDKTKKTDFLHTLDAYLRCNCNLKEASAQLFIHYNTLRYRIAKIEEILAMDLNESETRLNLQIALRMLKMRQVHHE